MVGLPAGCHAPVSANSTRVAPAVAPSVEPSVAELATETPDENTAESAPAYTSKTGSPDLPAPELDAFIAQQYPGYKVVKRVSIPDQIDSGRLSVAYLLGNKRQPAFRLLVNVAQLKPNETPRDAELSHYLDLVGRVLTNDDTFSVDAAQRYPMLSGGGQNAIIDAYAAQKPTPDAIAHDAQFDAHTGMDMGVETGPTALNLALENFGGAQGWTVDASPPTGPANSVVTLKLQQLPTQ